jgi:hypothetical protein
LGSGKTKEEYNVQKTAYIGKQLSPFDETADIYHILPLFFLRDEGFSKDRQEAHVMLCRLAVKP